MEQIMEEAKRRRLRTRAELFLWDGVDRRQPEVSENLQATAGNAPDATSCNQTGDADLSAG
jgi:hypothetical protein